MALSSFAAGQVLTASQLNAIVTAANTVFTGFTSSAVGTCNSALTLTTTLTDVSGCSVNATTTGANSYAMVTANAQFMVSVASAGVTLACVLLVDGVNQAANGTLRDSADQVHDGHRSFTWKVPLTAGAHTFKLQGNKSAAGSTSSITNTAGSNIVVMIFDLV